MLCRPGAENWQDHWCPSYFPVCNRVHVRAGDLVHLKVTHSELNIMFEVAGVDANSEEQQQHQQHQQEKKREEATATEVAGASWPSRTILAKREGRKRLFPPHQRRMCLEVWLGTR